jgi:hypothetical protein
MGKASRAFPNRKDVIKKRRPLGSDNSISLFAERYHTAWRYLAASSRIQIEQATQV